MTTEPQIASFLKTLSIYYYFLFFLLNSPEVHRTPNGGVPRTVAKKILRTMNNEQLLLFIQNKPNLNI